MYKRCFYQLHQHEQDYKLILNIDHRHKYLESLDIISEVSIGKECVTKWPIHRRHLWQNRSFPTPALAKLEKNRLLLPTPIRPRRRNGDRSFHL